MRDQRGSAFLIAVFLLMVLTMLAIGVVTTATTDLKISDNYTRSVRNLYTADAGASHVLALLENNAAYGNLTPYPSGTPLTTGSIGNNSYSIWCWNKKITGTGTILNFTDPRSRQFRVVASDKGRSSRRIEGVAEPAKNYPRALDRAVFACGNVSLPNGDDAFRGPLYSGGNVFWDGSVAGSGSNVEAYGTFTGTEDVNGYIYANGAIINVGCDSGTCKAGGAISDEGNCGGAATDYVSPAPVKEYCDHTNAASWRPDMIDVDPDKLAEIYTDTPEANRVGTWSTSGAIALSDSYYYVTGGDVTFTGNLITYAGHSVIVIDGGNFICNGCRINAGNPASSTITIITRSGNMSFTGAAAWVDARVVLWAGAIDADGNLPAAGNITIASTASIDIRGEVVAMGNITSARELDVTLDDVKPPVFSDKRYVISEWREVR